MRKQDREDFLKVVCTSSIVHMSPPHNQIRGSMLVSISASKAEDPGSIPSRGCFHSSHVAYEPMRPANFAPIERTTQPLRMLKLEAASFRLNNDYYCTTSSGAEAHVV